MKDPFERVSIDLESALSELTASTRARLDDIGPRRDDLRPVVARAAGTGSGKVPAPPARPLSAARLPVSRGPAPASRVTPPRGRSGPERTPVTDTGAGGGGDGADTDRSAHSEPAPTAVPSRSATPHSPSSVGFYSTVRLRPRVASRPARVGLPVAPPADDPATPVADAREVAREDAREDAREVDAVAEESAWVESPVAEEVLVEESVVEEPVVEQSVVEEPVVEEPVVEEPVVEEPVAVEEPVVEEPVVEEPVIEEPVAVEEPAVEEPESVGGPTAEEDLPTVETAAVETPAVEHAPAARERVVDDPRAEPAPASSPSSVPTYAVAPRLLGRDRPLRPTAAPSRPGRRRALLAAAGVAAAVLVLVVGFLASGPLRDDATRRAVAPAALPAAPGAAPSPGRLTDVRVQGDGSVEVTEWLTLSRPARSVRILPAAGRPARLSDAVVDGAGRARIDLGGSAAPQVVTFGEGVERVLVRYTVEDAVSLSAQDRDRALLDLPLLGMSAPGGALSGPRVVRVRDGLVLGAACGPSRASAEPCGVQRDRGWRTGKATAKRSSVFLASVDLG